MGWLGTVLGFLGAGSGDGSGAGGLAVDIREAIKGKELDPAEMIRLQGEINKLEAQNPSKFVSGWRPFIGWVSGFALAYNYILRPFIEPIYKIYHPEIILPILDMGELMPILLGMLGIAGMRSYEKTKGKTL